MNEVWIQFDDDWINLTHIARIEREGTRVRFLNAHGELIYIRGFDGEESAREAVESIVKHVDVIVPEYQGRSVGWTSI